MAEVKVKRPPGRPKTNWYETLSARVPQELADQVRKYAARKRQSLSDVFRDGFTLLIQEDRYAPMVSDTNSAQIIMSDSIPTPAIPSGTNGTQESMSDTLHQQRLRKIVVDMQEDAPEQEILSDMNGARPMPLATADVDVMRTQRRALLLSAVPWETETPEGISPTKLETVTGVSDRDVMNDLKNLHKQGQVKRVGKGRYVRSSPAPVA